METGECCGTCKHHCPSHEKGRFIGWICDNEDSEAYGCETSYKDGCMDYEEQEY